MTQDTLNRSANQIFDLSSSVSFLLQLSPRSSTVFSYKLDKLELLVFDEMLQRIQARVRTLDYVMTIHADEEMDDDGLSIFDIENVLLTGRVVERQRDRQTREWKYLIKGQTQTILISLSLPK